MSAPAAADPAPAFPSRAPLRHRLSRRVQTLIVGGALFVVLAIVGLAVPVPYAILGPGPTVNTLGTYDKQQVIAINGKTANKVSGNLNLTTVSVTLGHVSAVQAMVGWLAHDQVVVPRETIVPPGQSEKQVSQQDAEDFTNSQDDAEGAAFCELKYPKYFGVLGVADQMKPKGALKVGDRLVSLDGQGISTRTALQSVLSTKVPGRTATVVVVRGGKRTTNTLTLLDPATGARGARMGITVAQTCFAPDFTVTLGLNNDIGGPSAGMMFALGIMEKVGTQDLTGGKFIAGTGTIDPNGQVGPIGGIQLKMIAARRAGASVFLAPQSNCADVRGNVPKGLTVAKVATLHGAVQALQEINAGKSVPSC